MSKKKILLINPPQEKPLQLGIEDDFIDIIGYYPPLGLLYLATCLQNAGYEAKIIDCVPMKIGYEQLEKEISEYKPFMVGVTTYTPMMWDVLTTVNLAKKTCPETYTILGGHHPTLYPSESIKYENVDFIIQGEGEESLVKLVQALETNQSNEELAKIDGIGFFRENTEYLSAIKAYVKNIDELPIPDRSFLPFDIYKSIVGRNDMLATVMSSRGCPFRCTFCFTPNKKYRSRSNENILKEVNYLVDLGFKEIFFFDDLFALKNEKVIEFSKALRQQNIKIDWSFRARVTTITQELIEEIKKSGVHRIQFGIESGVDATLKRIKKDTNTQLIRNAIGLCKKNGIQTVGSFIIGLPQETKDDILQTIKFSRQIGLTYAQYNIFMPYPFTEAYLKGLKDGVFNKDFWKTYADDPINETDKFVMEYWTKEVSAEFLFEISRKAFKRFYFRPSVIWDKLLSIQSFQEFKYAVIGAISVFKFKPSKK